MSLNISGNKMRVTSAPTIIPKISEIEMFADLSTSYSTGRVKVDPVTGEIKTDPKTGKEIMERNYSNWKGVFVKDAFIIAKILDVGSYITVTDGFLVAERYKNKEGRDCTSYKVIIKDFVLAEFEEGDDTNTVEEDE